MKKVTVNLPQGDWGTIKTKYPKDSEKVKFNEFTGTSQNFDTEYAGVIQKALGSVIYNPSLLSSAVNDQYEAIFNDGTHHLLVMDAGTLKYSAGGGIFSSSTGGYSSSGNMEFAMYQNRAYFGNGIDNPQSYDLTSSYGGVSYGAGPHTKQMGALVPTAPSAVLVLAAGNVPAGAHTYKCTYLYYDSEESNGSPASSVVTADGTHQQVTVTIPVGGYGVTQRKIYRDNNDGNWLFVGSVANNTATTFTDNVALGTTFIPTDNGLPPTFSKIIQYLDRVWCAGVSSSASTLYFSQAGAPDLFSSTGFILCNPRDPIVGLVVYLDRIIVLNRQSIGQILGTDTLSFRYSEIPSSIGCVDNRSIQVRTFSGIPTLVWLSDKGLYEFDGNSIYYRSDAVEDQINFNIQQASQVKGKNVEDTQADFQAGTSSPGINITSSGFVTQNNPAKAYQVEADYVSGTSVEIALHSVGNVIQAVIGNSYTLALGAFNGCILNGGNITFTPSVDFTGLNNMGAAQCRYENNGEVTQVAQQFRVPRAGTLNSVSVLWNARTTGNDNPRIKVYSDAGNFPGSPLYTGTPHIVNGNNQTITDSGLGLALAANQAVWIVVTVQQVASADGTSTTAPGPAMSLASTFNGRVLRFNNGGFWEVFPTFSGVVNPNSMCMSFSYVSSPLSQSGTWISTNYDTQSDTAAPTTFAQAGTYPTACSATTFLEGSNDQSTWDISISYASQNGSTAVSTSNRRYWRVRCILVTTDDRNVPLLGAPSILFPTTATWTSPAIDHTTDITALNALTMTSSTPAGTSATIQIATSSDNISYSSYSAVGSATPLRYSKILVTLTTDGGNTVSATANNIKLTWTIVSTQTSPGIDTSNTPVGWELFQATVGSLGTVTFQVRTATTSGGLSSAGYVTVTNGAFISATVNRWIQWKATLTSTDQNGASIDSVTINWFIQIVNSIRVASVFYNRTYYLSAATFGSTTNNICFKLDETNKWRTRSGENVKTLSLFFNQPYACLAGSGQLVKWLTGSTFSGGNITMDVQTAAINYDDIEHNKILRKVYVQGKNTGAVYTPQYSTDNGLTWKGMVNVDTGLTTFTTLSDGGLFTKRLMPVFASDNATGRTHIFRLINSDANAAEVHSMRLEAWIRSGEVLNG